MKMQVKRGQSISYKLNGESRTLSAGDVIEVENPDTFAFRDALEPAIDYDKVETVDEPPAEPEDDESEEEEEESEEEPKRWKPKSD